MTKKINLSKEEIIHLAKLANLQLTDGEIEKYQKQLSETIHYVENLDELDTKDVQPTSQTTDLQDIFFEDGEENKRVFSQEEATENAKNKKEGAFVVKRIL